MSAPPDVCWIDTGFHRTSCVGYANAATTSSATTRRYTKTPNSSLTSWSHVYRTPSSVGVSPTSRFQLTAVIGSRATSCSRCTQLCQPNTSKLCTNCTPSTTRFSDLNTPTSLDVLNSLKNMRRPAVDNKHITHVHHDEKRDTIS